MEGTLLIDIWSTTDILKAYLRYIYEYEGPSNFKLVYCIESVVQIDAWKLFFVNVWHIIHSKIQPESAVKLKYRKLGNVIVYFS